MLTFNGLHGVISQKTEPFKAWLLLFHSCVFRHETGGLWIESKHSPNLPASNTFMKVIFMLLAITETTN
jgi:hypothetical protein